MSARRRKRARPKPPASTYRACPSCGSWVEPWTKCPGCFATYKTARVAVCFFCGERRSCAPLGKEKGCRTCLVLVIRATG